MKILPKILTVIGILFILSGGGAYVLCSMVYIEYAHLAVPMAALSAGIGAVVLTINAVIYPESIQRPDAFQPKIYINLPPEIGERFGYRRDN